MQISPFVRKPFFWFPTRFGTNGPAQAKTLASILESRIKKKEILLFNLWSEKKVPLGCMDTDADQFPLAF